MSSLLPPLLLSPLGLPLSHSLPPPHPHFLCMCACVVCVCVCVGVCACLRVWCCQVLLQQEDKHHHVGEAPRPHDSTGGELRYRRSGSCNGVGLPLWEGVSSMCLPPLPSPPHLSSIGCWLLSHLCTVEWRGWITHDCCVELEVINCPLVAKPPSLLPPLPSIASVHCTVLLCPGCRVGDGTAHYEPYGRCNRASALLPWLRFLPS